MSVENVLDQVTSEMPNPTPVADIIQQKAEKEIENAAQNSVNSESPAPAQKLNKDGSPAKKRGRKSNAEKTAANPSRLGGFPSAGERAAAADDAERLAAATLITKCMEMSGMAIAGDVAKMFPPEAENLSNCWEKYLRKMGINDIPPGIAVTLFSLQYYSRVLVTPEAQPFTQKIANKFRNIFMRLRNARINSGNDKQRQDNPSEKDAAEIPGKRNTVFGSRSAV